MAKILYQDEIVQGALLKEYNKIFSQQANFYIIQDGHIFFGDVYPSYVRKFGIFKKNPDCLSCYSNLLINSTEARAFFAHFRKSKVGVQWSDDGSQMALLDGENRLTLNHMTNEQIVERFCAREYRRGPGPNNVNFSEHFSSILDEVSKRKYKHRIVSKDYMERLSNKEFIGVMFDKMDGSEHNLVLTKSLFGGMKHIRGIEYWEDDELSKVYDPWRISVIIFRQIYDDMDIYTIAAVT